ncbi:DUF3616 domain-containing protein [Bradyrhizobium sp. B097]|uniref:DUF3616 domain-containing protein n=1 Tax=Bradyrhizobium sp. B097 TaxID=3140244 RepID=UPI0031831DF6
MARHATVKPLMRNDLKPVELMVTSYSRAAAVCLLLILACAADPGHCREEQAWPVKKTLVGKDGGKSKDVSGIACSTATGFPRSCLVIDDDMQAAQLVTLHDGELIAGKTIDLIDNTFEGRPLELDGEGVAFANGFYYVIGSHGHPRDKKHKLDPKKHADEIKARISASSQVVRVPASTEGTSADGIERTDELRNVLASSPILAASMDKRLEENGLTIEGIAIKSDGTLLAGLRGPILGDERAVVVPVAVESLFSGPPGAAEPFRLSLGKGRGVRDLARFGDGILILAGPMADGPGVYAIFSWDGASENVTLLAELTSFDAERKPEALLPLDKSPAGLRVLILFDGDKEGAPTPVTVPLP